MIEKNVNSSSCSLINPYLPKFKQIKQFVIEKIRRDEFKIGELIPSDKELAFQFSVDKNTVIKALNELRMEGIVNRVPSKGTFVAPPKTVLKAEAIVGLIMPATGHLYGPLATGIMKGLTEYHYFCLMVDFSSTNDPKQSYEKIKSLVDGSPGILVIEGKSSFPFELLEHYQGRIIFVDVYETKRSYPSTRILSDYYEGGRIVVEHFIRTGYQKIFYFTNLPKPDQKTHFELIAGARRALCDHNLPEENFVLYSDSDDVTQLDETLKNIEKPLAVFCHSDARAKRIYAASRRLGLRIPQDLSIIGYYNTPWCEVFEPNLSSVSIREQDMAEHIVETILTGNDRNILLKPELILRDSSINS